MASLIYSAIASLDGFTADENGTFDRAAPDEEVHAFVNDTERPFGTYPAPDVRDDGVPGDRPTGDDQPAAMRDYAGIWQAADKVVYSSTLDAPGPDSSGSSTRTRRVTRRSPP